MYEKILVVAIYCIIIALCIGGCATTKPAGTATDIAATGANATGQLEQLDKQLESIQQRARDELDRAAGTTEDLAGTIQSVFNIAYGLCDEIEDLRGQIKSSADKPSQREVDGIHTGSDIGNPLLD